MSRGRDPNAAAGPDTVSTEPVWVGARAKTSTLGRGTFEADVSPTGVKPAWKRPLIIWMPLLCQVLPRLFEREGLGLSPEQVMRVA